MPQISALRFELWCLPPRSGFIIVWPDRPAGNARPVDRNQHWLDVRAGDEIFIRGKRRTVKSVHVYRGEGAGNDEPVVECGREWVST